jgi:hypothetical protein
MKRVSKRRKANPEGGYGSYNGAPSKAESPIPERGTGRPVGGRGQYGASNKGGGVSSANPKGIFGKGD